MNTLKSLAVPAAFALTLLATGCASYRDADAVVDAAQVSTQQPPLPVDLATDGFFSARQPVAAWWSQLQDAELDQLVTRSLQHNLTLRIASASLAESRALLRSARQQWVPQVDANATSTRQQQAGNPLLGNGVITETAQGGLAVQWEADLFGRIGSEVAVGAAQAEASAAELQAAQVSIAAEVASAYVALRGAQHQLAVAQDNVRNQQETFELTQRLVEIGRGDQFDITRAQAQLDRTRAGIPLFEAAINTALNRLAVLTNQDFASVKQSLAQPKSLPSLPAAVAIGNAEQLLQRRPDVRRAEYALRGAVAGYNVRVADYYPRLTFGGSLGYQASDWGMASGWQSGQVFAFSPTLSWGVLNIGRLRSQVDAADARVEASIAAFEQSVLVALEETDNALQQFSREEERRLHLLAAAQASTQAADFARQRFEIGSDDFLSVLDAQRSQLGVSAELAQSETQLLLNLVDVYRALGGGWTY